MQSDKPGGAVVDEEVAVGVDNSVSEVKVVVVGEITDVVAEVDN